MIELSLKRLLVDGDFGPLRLGASMREVVAAVGEPDWGGRDVLEAQTIWRYGDIELIFDGPGGNVWLIDLHHFEGAPRGGARVELDPWFVRAELPLGDLMRVVSDAGLTVRQHVPSFDDTQLYVIFKEEPAVYVSVNTATDDFSPPLGLYGVWVGAEVPNEQCDFTNPD
jgi:hypothetical protein